MAGMPPRCSATQAASTAAVDGTTTATSEILHRAREDSAAGRPSLNEPADVKPTAAAAAAAVLAMANSTSLPRGVEPQVTLPTSSRAGTTAATIVDHVAEHDATAALERRIQLLEAQQGVLLKQVNSLLEEKQQRDAQARRSGDSNNNAIGDALHAVDGGLWSSEEKIRGQGRTWLPASDTSSTAQLSTRTPEKRKDNKLSPLPPPPSRGSRSAPPRRAPAAAGPLPQGGGRQAAAASALDANPAWKDVSAGGGILNTPGNGSMSLNSVGYGNSVNNHSNNSMATAHLAAAPAPPHPHRNGSFCSASMSGDAAQQQQQQPQQVSSRVVAGRQRQSSFVTVVSPTHSMRGEKEAAAAQDGSNVRRPSARAPTTMPSPPAMGICTSPSTSTTKAAAVGALGLANFRSDDPLSVTPPALKRNSSLLTMSASSTTHLTDTSAAGSQQSSTSNFKSNNHNSSTSLSKTSGAGVLRLPPPKQRPSSETLFASSQDGPSDSSENSNGVARLTRAREQTSFDQRPPRVADMPTDEEVFGKGGITPTTVSPCTTHTTFPLPEVRPTRPFNEGGSLVDEFRRLCSSSSSSSSSNSLGRGGSDGGPLLLLQQQQAPTERRSPSPPTPTAAHRIASFAASMDQCKAVGELFQQVLSLGHSQSLLDDRMQKMEQRVGELGDDSHRSQRRVQSHLRKLYALHDYVKQMMIAHHHHRRRRSSSSSSGAADEEGEDDDGEDDDEEDEDDEEAESTSRPFVLLSPPSVPRRCLAGNRHSTTTNSCNSSSSVNNSGGGGHHHAGRSDEDGSALQRRNRSSPPHANELQQRQLETSASVNAEGHEYSKPAAATALMQKEAEGEEGKTMAGTVQFDSGKEEGGQIEPVVATSLISSSARGGAAAARAGGCIMLPCFFLPWDSARASPSTFSLNESSSTTINANAITNTTTAAAAALGGVVAAGRANPHPSNAALLFSPTGIASSFSLTSMLPHSVVMASHLSARPPGLPCTAANAGASATALTEIETTTDGDGDGEESLRAWSSGLPVAPSSAALPGAPSNPAQSGTPAPSTKLPEKSADTGSVREVGRGDGEPARTPATATTPTTTPREPEEKDATGSGAAVAAGVAPADRTSQLKETATSTEKEGRGSRVATGTAAKALRRGSSSNISSNSIRSPVKRSPLHPYSAVALRTPTSTAAATPASSLSTRARHASGHNALTAVPRNGPVVWDSSVSPRHQHQRPQHQQRWPPLPPPPIKQSPMLTPLSSSFFYTLSPQSALTRRSYSSIASSPAHHHPSAAAFAPSAATPAATRITLSARASLRKTRSENANGAATTAASTAASAVVSERKSSVPDAPRSTADTPHGASTVSTTVSSRRLYEALQNSKSQPAPTRSGRGNDARWPTSVVVKTTGAGRLSGASASPLHSAPVSAAATADRKEAAVPFMDGTASRTADRSRHRTSSSVLRVQQITTTAAAAAAPTSAVSSFASLLSTAAAAPPLAAPSATYATQSPQCLRTAPILLRRSPAAVTATTTTIASARAAAVTALRNELTPRGTTGGDAAGDAETAVEQVQHKPSSPQRNASLRPSSASLFSSPTVAAAAAAAAGAVKATRKVSPGKRASSSTARSPSTANAAVVAPAVVVRCHPQPRGRGMRAMLCRLIVQTDRHRRHRSSSASGSGRSTSSSGGDGGGRSASASPVVTVRSPMKLSKTSMFVSDRHAAAEEEEDEEESSRHDCVGTAATAAAGALPAGEAQPVQQDQLGSVRQAECAVVDALHRPQEHPSAADDRSHSSNNRSGRNSSSMNSSNSMNHSTSATTVRPHSLRPTTPTQPERSALRDRRQRAALPPPLSAATLSDASFSMLHPTSPVAGGDEPTLTFASDGAHTEKHDADERASPAAEAAFDVAKNTAEALQHTQSPSRPSPQLHAADPGENRSCSAHLANASPSPLHNGTQHEESSAGSGSRSVQHHAPPPPAPHTPSFLFDAATPVSVLSSSSMKHAQRRSSPQHQQLRKPQRSSSANAPTGQPSASPKTHADASREGASY
ncbi:hypothetical protein ABB37_09735 [Leptomonas pyrrhocoris]|uniref:Uncharacterized protein n=1 Tax=Leptomonas pyrrhocoris TaxID=157538 RepID=A0A0M9FPZ1_LEPPY|nr:hypothetical protein ABB37_09735 [Leptomonas pyrrhocoris]KPA73603.1 hypothetical protein ABB37_09735 [Leptomonas pyrrhocoris]|eukprot:XP_015652042.1 hypothetical protein ABB37_09735 [Leptomonas pyrrhocoris]